MDPVLPKPAATGPTGMEHYGFVSSLLLVCLGATAVGLSWASPDGDSSRWLIVSTIFLAMALPIAVLQYASNVSANRTSRFVLGWRKVMPLYPVALQMVGVLGSLWIGKPMNAEVHRAGRIALGCVLGAVALFGFIPGVEYFRKRRTLAGPPALLR